MATNEKKGKQFLKNMAKAFIAFVVFTCVYAGIKLQLNHKDQGYRTPPPDLFAKLRDQNGGQTGPALTVDQQIRMDTPDIKPQYGTLDLTDQYQTEITVPSGMTVAFAIAGDIEFEYYINHQLVATIKKGRKMDRILVYEGNKHIASWKVKPGEGIHEAKLAVLIYKSDNKPVPDKEAYYYDAMRKGPLVTSSHLERE